ncbi:MAG: DNA repair protein RecN [Spirochaetales bacterium]|nr:DNA repair protein RecN [Spirochaetales bacterium]
MLEELVIENVALIEKVEIRFGRGLNVLTGETGAGKSILVGSLSLLLGAPADKNLIREGKEEARVSGILPVRDIPELAEWYEKYGIEPEENTLLIRRTIKRTGRGTIYVQSQPVNLAALQELGAMLFDMHSQHEHQSLFVLENHRKLLDRYGGLVEETAELTARFQELSRLREEIEKMDEDRESRERDAELARYAAEEIESAALKDGEEEELNGRVELLSSQEDLMRNWDMLTRLMTGAAGVIGSLEEARESVDKLSPLMSGEGEISRRFESASLELEDIYDSLRQAMDRVSFSPEEQAEADERLLLIHQLKKKYGSSIGEINAYGAQCRERLALFESGDGGKEALMAKKGEMEKELSRMARELSEKRRVTAEKLQEKIEANLRELGMESGRFVIDLNRKQTSGGVPLCGPYGIDSIEFLLSANRGMALKPLKSVASGGEISRVMLALKSVFAAQDIIETLVFDEIDTGIGGEVALSIGRHFRKLARDKQIFTITHLASIASFADNHIRIEKKSAGERTQTYVTQVTGDERREEVARMLAGDSRREASLAHAEELLLQNSPEGVY